MIDTFVKNVVYPTFSGSFKLEVDKEYILCITTIDDDGIYWGKVLQIIQPSVMRKTCTIGNTEDSRCDNLKDEGSNVAFSSTEQLIQISEKKMREKNERLEVERQLFERKK